MSVVSMLSRFQSTKVKYSTVQCQPISHAADAILHSLLISVFHFIFALRDSVKKLLLISDF